MFWVRVVPLVIENVSQQPWEYTMKILGVSLVVASLLVLAACSGGQDSATHSAAGAAGGGGGGGGGAEQAPALVSTAKIANPAPADGTVIMLDVGGMT